MLRTIRAKTVVVALAVAVVTSVLSFVAALVYYERRLAGLPSDVRELVDRQVLSNTPDDFDGIAELVTAATVAALAGAILGAVLTRRHARLVGAVSATARELRAGHLHARADGGRHRWWRDEGDQLVVDVNHMAEQLEALEHERATTAATIAHELRTPIAVLHARLQAHLDGVIDPSAAETRLLLDQTLVLERLIDDLRTLSLHNAKRLTLLRRPVDVVALLGDCADAMRLLDPRPIRFDRDGTVVASVDPDRVHQLVVNLIANAQQHTPQDAEITLRLDADADTVTISVTDASPSAGGARRAPGSQLGLGVVAAIAEAHGGGFRYDDTPTGRSSTVTLAR